MVGGRRIGSFQGEGEGKEERYSDSEGSQPASQPCFHTHTHTKRAVKFAYIEIYVSGAFYTNQTKPNYEVTDGRTGFLN